MNLDLMDVEVIIVIAIIATAGIWIIQKFIKSSKSKSCSCGGSDESKGGGCCKK